MNSVSHNRRTVFTVEQANQMLPLVRSIAADISELWQDVSSREERLSLVRYNREDRDDVYSEELVEIEKGLMLDTQRLQELMRELRDLGLVPGDSKGSVGFPSMLEGRKVVLSWQLGESEVAYWHEYDQGFDDRQLLQGEALTTENGIYLDVN